MQPSKSPAKLLPGFWLCLCWVFFDSAPVSMDLDVKEASLAVMGLWFEAKI